ncbi:WXG100 family type VII secretion target [Streptomyces sp. NPDC090080]|uniref:WXG100 family type VII secretion target n=1 Tax=Streptomyces sp. NPDC090080 TaxID=3365939 RepID=UPI003821E982
MTDSGDTYFDHQKADAFIQTVNQHNSDIVKTMNTLQTELQTLMGTWSGDDKDQYGDVQHKWNSRVAALSQVLDNHTQLLGEIGSSYKKTTMTNAEGFQGVRV